MFALAPLLHAAGALRAATSAAAVLLLLSACASPPVAGGGVRQGNVLLAGQLHAAEWALPAGPAQAVFSLQHGFARDCSHLRGLARRIADAGVLVLCIDLGGQTAGGLAVADALAAALTGQAGLSAPDGSALPDRVIVGGHSAGAQFALRLAGRIDALAPGRVVGGLLFDPVAAGSFADDLRALSDGGRRPVLAVTAGPHACNANGNAAGNPGIGGVQLTDGATHIDAEGPDTSWWAAAACGTPLPHNVEALRVLAAGWAADLAAGARTPAFYPGGAVVEDLRNARRGRWLQP